MKLEVQVGEVEEGEDLTKVVVPLAKTQFVIAVIGGAIPVGTSLLIKGKLNLLGTFSCIFIMAHFIVYARQSKMKDREKRRFKKRSPGDCFNKLIYKTNNGYPMYILLQSQGS